MEAVFCAMCSAPIAADGFSLSTNDGKMLCAKCAAATRGKTASPVLEPITAVGIPLPLDTAADGGVTKFYFCETCGKRITDKQILEGLGRDKKLKGVYCKDCAVGVMTMEMDAISIEQLGKNKPRSSAAVESERDPTKRPPRKGSGIARAIESPIHATSLPAAAAPNKSKPAQSKAPIVAAVGIGVFLVGVFSLAVVHSQNAPPHVSTAPPSAPALKTPPPIVTPELPRATPPVEPTPPAEHANAVAPATPVSPVTPVAPQPVAGVKAPEPEIPAPKVAAPVPAPAPVPSPSEPASPSAPPLVPATPTPEISNVETPAAPPTPATPAPPPPVVPAQVPATPAPPANTVAGRIRQALAGEVLKAGNDYSVEVRYDFVKNPKSAADFQGPLTPVANGLALKGQIHWQKEFGNSNVLRLTPVFQPKALHIDYVFAATGHDIEVGRIGNAHIKTRWVGGGNIKLVYGAIYASDFGLGAGWRHPNDSPGNKLSYERTPDKLRVFVDDKEIVLKEALPPEARSEKDWFATFTMNTDSVLKEVIVKGYVDEAWLKEKVGVSQARK